MTQRGRRLIALGLAATAFAWAPAGCAHRPDVPKADYRAALSLPVVGPVPYRRTTFDKNPMVVTFFATWCFPCLGQMALFAELQREFSGQGLQVVAVGMDLEGKKVLEPFANQSGYPFPVLVADERVRAGQTPFGPVRELPATVILDRRGEVVAAWPGVAQAEEIREALKTAVSR